jgi:hypothetical protein
MHKQSWCWEKSNKRYVATQNGATHHVPHQINHWTSHTAFLLHTYTRQPHSERPPPLPGHHATDLGQPIIITSTANNKSAAAAITYLNRHDLTIRASETLITYSINKTATHAALQALEHYLCTPHTSKTQTTLIITTNAKLAHIINTNTINNPTLRSKEKYQMILTRLHSYATTASTHLSALLVPLQNKFEWHISNTRPDQYPFRLEAIPNATVKIINVINTTHSKAKKCLENAQPSNKLHISSGMASQKPQSTLAPTTPTTFSLPTSPKPSANTMSKEP